ncbi:hypothetical protein [Variovorax saccharolyticus]|uniref:hypothetical protein n=1 Tax=Variovorax saccharolyticus TaxID=3053516 RepID=UPI00257738BA|nr:hypothetical protein [Variovorax sp. J31P216]MDM0030086.1 hypothetical protein [Variovorax sp. J31P216]
MLADPIGSHALLKTPQFDPEEVLTAFRKRPETVSDLQLAEAIRAIVKWPSEHPQKAALLQGFAESLLPFRSRLSGLLSQGAIQAALVPCLEKLGWVPDDGDLALLDSDPDAPHVAMCPSMRMEACLGDVPPFGVQLNAAYPIEHRLFNRSTAVDEICSKRQTSLPVTSQKLSVDAPGINYPMVMASWLTARPRDTLSNQISALQADPQSCAKAEFLRELDFDRLLQPKYLTQILANLNRSSISSLAPCHDSQSWRSPPVGVRAMPPSLKMHFIKYFDYLVPDFERSIGRGVKIDGQLLDEIRHFALAGDVGQYICEHILFGWEKRPIEHLFEAAFFANHKPVFAEMLQALVKHPDALREALEGRPSQSHATVFHCVMNKHDAESIREVFSALNAAGIGSDGNFIKNLLTAPNGNGWMPFDLASSLGNICEVLKMLRYAGFNRKDFVLSAFGHKALRFFENHQYPLQQLYQHDPEDFKKHFPMLLQELHCIEEFNVVHFIHQQGISKQLIIELAFA